MDRIIFLGSNPSEKSATTLPFWHDTKSLTILQEWLTHFDMNLLQNINFMNVANYSTPGNRALKVSEIKAELDRLRKDIEDIGPTKIVALGRTAEKALELLGMDYYGMPHPSGLNRKLNDPEYVAEKINGLKNYLEAVKDSI